MTTTGIIRRVDDLGRVVIPKEIRRFLQIREGDPFEIFTDEHGVYFKKYSPMGATLQTTATLLCKSIEETCGAKVAVCDRHTIIATSTHVIKSALEDRPISTALQYTLESRQQWDSEGEKPLPVTINGDYTAGVVIPVLWNGELFGGVILLNEPGHNDPTAFGDTEVALARNAATYLGNQVCD